MRRRSISWYNHAKEIAKKSPTLGATYRADHSLHGEYGHKGWKNKWNFIDNLQQERHRMKRDGFSNMRNTEEFRNWWAEQGRCQDWCCAWCKKDIKGKNHKKQVDHIKPLLRGGSNDFNNLVLSCPECNRKAGTAPYRVKPSWIKPNKFVLQEKIDKPSRPTSEKGSRFWDYWCSEQLHAQHNLCAWCKKRLEEYRIMYLKPLHLGGGKTYNNLVISCLLCESKRSSRENVRPGWIDANRALY